MEKKVPAKYPHEGHRERLRERFQTQGADALSETELLELILFFSIPRVDTKPLAKTLLESFGSLDGVLAATPEELHAFARISGNTDTLFAVLRLLTQRAVNHMKHADFRSADFAKQYLPRQFAGYTKERVLLFFLGSDGSLLHRQTAVSCEEGTVQLSVPNVVQVAKNVGASALVMAHNHPAGFALPSSQDYDCTVQVRRALETLQVQLSDHIIFAENEFISMRQTAKYAGAFSKYACDDSALEWLRPVDPFEE
jgi:DNA repair protein RadC